MARNELKYTLPGTVVHGRIIEGDKAVFVSYELEGSYLNEKRAENHVRKHINPTFSLEKVTHFAKVWKMPIRDFCEHAQLVDIIEKD